MEIHDIIKADSDRLFIVDHECYIIFTGETTDDIKPFIRIGNWIDMPVELIPLIENIIVTDGLIGNPAHEQFNIDVRDLPENRYIGSRGIVKKFFDYQKIFGLDLTNASIVDIEKDLPELSKEKNISHKDQFIGVFYRDGNFKTLLNKNTIFDLNLITGNPISWQKFHDLLAATHGGSDRYDGSGMVVIGHNPMFYDRGRFHSYLFPGDYIRDFSLLGIDPGKIRSVFHPSLNLINISKLLKWLNASGRSITLFCNSTDIDLLKRLFSNCSIRNSEFTGMDFTTEPGITVTNYPGTYNLKVRYNAVRPHGQPLNIAFIKGPAGVREILRDRPDALLITYSAFEDVHMLLKSTDTPCAIIDDGNRNVAKLAGGDRIILSPGSQYEFRAFHSIEEMVSLSGLENSVIERITGDTASIASEFSAGSIDTADPDRIRQLCNLLSLVRMYINNTGDRDLSARLRSLAGTMSLMAARCRNAHDPSRSIVVLALYNGALYPLVVGTGSSASVELFDVIGRDREITGFPENPVMGEYYARIVSDRERLGHLIDIYTRSEKYNQRNAPHLHQLKEAISRRKQEYGEESLSLERSWERSIASAAEASADATQIAAGSSAGEREPGVSAAEPRPAAQETAPAGPRNWAAQTARKTVADRVRSLPRAAKIGASAGVLLCIAALIALVIMMAGQQTGKRLIGGDEGPVVHSRDLDERYRHVEKQMSVRISDSDIYRYANEVAIKNGYNRIAPSRIRERNPDWIFPENVFIMLDGQRVVISEGDTLWNLAKNKLIESAIAFDDIMKRAETAGPEEKRRLLEKARRHAHIAEQRETLNRMIKTGPAPARGPIRDDH
ncbi:MAG: hypothetical protein JXA07_03240 [Spirochaetes bacterium]|nr:hypothetical protein [Spirochaetota bacterium]